MFLQCPSCMSDLTLDFGITQCPKCSATLFVDYDGRVQLSAPTSFAPVAGRGPAPGVDLDPAFIRARSVDPEAHQDQDAPTAVPVDGAAAPESPFASEGTMDSIVPIDVELDVVENAEPFPAVAAPSAPIPGFEADFAVQSGSVATGPAPSQPETEYVGLSGLDLGAPSEPASPAEKSASEDSTPSPDQGLDLGFRSTPDDPLGLNAFANSEVSQGKDGPLVFRLLISGIDSKETRESIREAMTDSRFGWNASEILSRTRMGSLEIDGLSPIKATVLVNRLKRLPVRIRWEQNAVVQLEPSLDPEAEAAVEGGAAPGSEGGHEPSSEPESPLSSLGEE